MKTGIALAAASFVLAWPFAARAEPEPAYAMFAGALTETVGFVAGAALLGVGQGQKELGRAGWMVMSSAFTLAPIAAHGAVGEWKRGLVFSAMPAACLAGTTTMFIYEPNAVDYSNLWEQRGLWLLFGAGLTTSVIGVIDAMLVNTRGVKIAPAVTARSTGLLVGGEF
jgi:hypothetical protein